MKKLNLKMQGIGEMLSKEQMKNVVGGDYGTCRIANCTQWRPETGYIGGQCAFSANQGRCVCRVVVNGNIYETNDGNQCVS